MASPILHRDLRSLSHAYTVIVDDDRRWFIAEDFLLPPGFNTTHTSALVMIPSGYPVSPPGVGASKVYLPPYLRYFGQELKDLHPGTSPAWGDWAWFCYQHINWDPRQDNLVTFLEMVRADLTDPPTRSTTHSSPPYSTPPRRSLFRAIKEILT